MNKAIDEEEDFGENRSAGLVPLSFDDLTTP